MDINILNVGEGVPTGCAVFTVSAAANVYLEVKDRIKDAKKEVAKFKAKLTEAQRDQQDIESITAELHKVQDKDVTEALQSAQRRKGDVGAASCALEETVAMFERMAV